MSSSEPVPPQPPVAPARPVESTHHGRVRVDAYDWLREKDSPEVRAYLDAENAWTESQTAHLAPLRQQLFDEIKGHTLETDLSVPTRNRGWWYYSRSFEGRQYGASCRVPVTDPDDWTPPRPDEAAAPDRPALPGEELLLDLNQLAEGHDFFSLGGSSISPDGRRLGYSTDVVGDERYTARILDLGTRELAPDELTGVLGGLTWDRDSTHVYYTTVDASWRADRVWRHALGTEQTDDELVLHEPDARFGVGVGRTRSDRFVVVVSASKTTSEVRLLDADDPSAGLRLVHPRTEGLEYSVEHAVIGGVDELLVVHNGHGPDFEIGRLPLSALGEANGPDRWTPLIAHRAGVRLEDVDAFAGHLVVSQRSDGLTQLRILELGPDGVSDDRLVELEDEVHTVGAGGNPGFDQPVVRLGYTTLATPPSTYDYVVATRELRLLRQAPVLAFDPTDYEEHRTWATAPDGTRVPISYVHRRDARPDGRAIPFLLYGYGSYEISVDPYFSIARLSLLDRGAGFAIAHVRGGGELGRHWYDDGKLRHKQHTFSDFVACGRHLVDEGIASALVAEGGSAGGLLIGVVVTRAPELWAGAVADVPFVDPLTSMLDSSLPLTVTEYDEWGNPEADADAYDDIAAYAPYDTVAALDYPPILAETSLHDTRVAYVEPAKWVARLRATAVGRRDVLLKTEMSAGHGGVSGRYQAWHDRAFSLAWILDKLGLS